MPPKKDNAKGGGGKDKGGKAAAGSDDKGKKIYRLIQSAYENIFISRMISTENEN